MAVDYCNYINGYQIQTNVNMVKDGEPYDRPRGWVERLFSRPWHPLKAHETITPKIPSDEVLICGNTIVCHPAVADQLRHATKIGSNMAYNNSWPL